MDILAEILLQSTQAFLWGGSILGILLGVGVLFKSEQLMQLNRHAFCWIGTEKMAVHLDRPHRIEPFIYRHHRLVGAGILGGAIFVLHTFLFRYNVRVIASVIPHDYWWLSDALIGMLLVGSVLVALIGGIVLAKPSLLRDIEAVANGWIATERFLLRHHRLVGVFILLGSLYVFVVHGFSFVSGAGER